MSEYRCPMGRETLAESIRTGRNPTWMEGPSHALLPRVHVDDQTVCHPVLCALHKIALDRGGHVPPGTVYTVFELMHAIRREVER